MRGRRSGGGGSASSSWPLRPPPRSPTDRTDQGKPEPAAAGGSPQVAPTLRRTPNTAQLTSVVKQGKASSRKYPARGPRNLPPAPANPRNSRAGKPCSGRESPPIPAQLGSAMTGLSRRRSRVRVPSLTLKHLQIGIFCRPRRHKRPPASTDPASIPHESPGFAATLRSHAAPACRFHPRADPARPFAGGPRSGTTDERGSRCRPSHAVRCPFR
jgi:hypothetical protein